MTVNVRQHCFIQLKNNHQTDRKVLLKM